MVDRQKDLREVARVFFKLGCIGFGGPAVHIAMMQDEVVKKRKWMSQEHFLDLVGATNLIPGPNSTEMTMHCGKERAGWKGLFVAGICFIFPAVLITMVLAWAYKEYGALPEVAPFLYGIKPAIIAVVLSAMVALGAKAFKSAELIVIGVICLLASFMGVNEIAILFGAGAVGMIGYGIKNSKGRLNSIAPLALFSATNTKIFLVFLKIGSILYGSGYVLFAFLDAELVSTGMLSRAELMDAIAVGQFTPGPVFTAATFIGWQIGGIWGAVAATVGIFLPSFIFVALLTRIIPLLRKSRLMSAFLDTVNVAAVALILAVCIEMGKESIQDWRTLLIAVTSLVLVLKFKKLNTAFVVLGGACAGYLLSFL